jgi:hypothetical protein
VSFWIHIQQPARGKCASLVATWAGHRVSQILCICHPCCCHQAQAFAVSGRDDSVKSYALAVADAINTGGEQATTAYAQAFASGSAGGTRIASSCVQSSWTSWAFTCGLMAQTFKVCSCWHTMWLAASSMSICCPLIWPCVQIHNTGSSHRNQTWLC